MFYEGSIATPETTQDMSAQENQQSVFVEPFAIRAMNHNGSFVLESHRASSPEDMGYIRMKDENGQLLASFMNAYVMDFYIFGQIDKQSLPVYLDPQVALAHTTPLLPQTAASAGDSGSIESALAKDVAVLKAGTARGFHGETGMPSVEITSAKSTSQPEPLPLSVSVLPTGEVTAYTDNAHADEIGLSSEVDATSQSDLKITQPDALGVLDRVFNMAKSEIYKFFRTLSEGCSGDAEDNATESVAENGAVEKPVESGEFPMSSDSGVVKSEEYYNATDESQIASASVAEQGAAAHGDTLQVDKPVEASSTTAQLDKALADKAAAFVVAASGIAAMEALEEAAWFANLPKASTSDAETPAQTKDAVAVQSPEKGESAPELSSNMEAVPLQRPAALDTDLTVKAASASGAGTVESEVVSWEVQAPQEAALHMPVTVKTVYIGPEDTLVAADSSSSAGSGNGASSARESQTVGEEVAETIEMSLSMPETTKEAAIPAEVSGLESSAASDPTTDSLQVSESTALETRETVEALSVSETEKAVEVTTEKDEIVATAVENLAHDMPAPDLSEAREQEFVATTAGDAPAVNALDTESASSTARDVAAEAPQGVTSTEFADVKPEGAFSWSDVQETNTESSHDAMPAQEEVSSSDSGDTMAVSHPSEEEYRESYGYDSVSEQGTSHSIVKRMLDEADDGTDHQELSTSDQHSDDTEMVEQVSA